MKLLFILLTAVFLTACDQDPVAVSSSSNPKVPVSLLFEYDGCKVYRFYDGGYNHYYSKCENTTEAFTTISCGKGCTHPESIVTSY
jgi:hypothetical protein